MPDDSALVEIAEKLADEERRHTLAQVREALRKLDELQAQLQELELELSDVEPPTP